jgi:vanillate/3-O-methylgallate O-demethylase
MSKRSLEELLRSVGNPVHMLRNSQVGAYIYPVVPAEFSNWRDEQRAWQQTCVLYDQTHHMANLFVEGPDAQRLLAYLGVNTFRNFPVGKAKQFVPCGYDGYVVGDGILFHLDGDEYTFVGRTPTVNWIQFHAETGGYDVRLVRDDRSPSRPMGEPVSRTLYRYQIQGPNAEQVIAKLNGGSAPDVKFFNLDYVTVAGRRVRALRHGMAGEPGLEVFGPYEERDEIRDAILEAGEEFGLVPVGSRAYATNALESGWIPSPLPGVYTSDEMKPYREWLSEDSYEGAGGSLAGSFVSDDIADYCLNPYELGYGHLVTFDHDFVGRQALEGVDQPAQRRKVTLAWNGDDAAEVFASLFRPEQTPYKYIDLPVSNYSSASYDAVTRGDGTVVGLSMFTGYSHNERAMLSLATVDPDIEFGTEVSLVWGEPDGGTAKPTVERPHRQIAVRATVSPAPYSTDAREHYAKGWRTAQAR